jgi:hypothetical protein
MLLRERKNDMKDKENAHNLRMVVQNELDERGLVQPNLHKLRRPKNLSIYDLPIHYDYPFYRKSDEEINIKLYNFLVSYDLLEFLDYIIINMENEIWKICSFNKRSMWSKIMAAFYEGYIENVEPLDIGNVEYNILIRTMLHLLEGRVAYICYNRYTIMNSIYEKYVVRVDNIIRYVSIKVNDEQDDIQIIIVPLNEL